ncbi:neuronal acetylcholine receptor subunit beta-3-like [Argopecten irradians]|uniref:neuronal acetylcholine receptor subunit beta-3-like n=1 Tax=Argopecten irradians TaxID=31199 RepID=UPI003712885B
MGRTRRPSTSPYARNEPAPQQTSMPTPQPDPQSTPHLDFTSSGTMASLIGHPGQALANAGCSVSEGPNQVEAVPVGGASSSSSSSSNSREIPSAVIKDEVDSIEDISGLEVWFLGSSGLRMGANIFWQGYGGLGIQQVENRINKMKIARAMFQYFLTLNVIIPPVMAAGTLDDQTRLDVDLFRNYSKDLRPVYNLSDTVDVITSLVLLALLDFNEVSGTIHLSIILLLTWTDYRLAWNVSEYGGITNILVNSSRIWKPRIFMISSADDLVEFSDNHFDIRLMNNGSAFFSPGKLIKSSCTIDMTYFPTDSHVCSILVVPWMDTIQEVRLHFNESKFRMEFFTPHGAWEIYNTSIIRNVQFSRDVSVIEFTLYIRRKPQYFYLSLGVPILLLCFLNPFVFLLPAASGERISFAVTMFLSMTVYMSSIGEVMPKVSDPIAGASYFLLGAMCFSCLLILLTIASLYLHAVNDVNHYPGCLVVIATCHISKRKSGHPMGLTAVEKEHDANDDDQVSNVNKNRLKKSDVTKFMDKTFFWLTELFVFVDVLVFVLLYVRTN